MMDVYREADRLVLARYAPSGVLVDDALHIIQFRGDTGNYLKPAPGIPTTDLLLMAREGLLGDLRDAIEIARRDNVPVRKEGVLAKTNVCYQAVDLDVIPVIDPGSTLRHFVVLFRPTSGPAASEKIAPREQARSTAASGPDKDQEISRLDRDLTATKHYLQAVIEQKEAANEELRAANEEVVSANEEMQSTNEELTTTQEELQATNEELVTVNDELQDRIRVANQLGDDLSNLIETTRIPIVVLGPDLCVRRFTPAAQQAMNLDFSDVGRSLDFLKSKIDLPDLESLVHEVIDTLEIKQVEIADRKGAWYKLYIRPYKTLDQRVGGVILMFVDIDVLKRREREIEQARDYAISIVETVREPLLVLDGDLIVRTANRSFYRDFRVAPEETEGRPIYELGDGLWDIPRLRYLLETILPKDSHFEDFEVSHVLPDGDERTMLLNAHRVVPTVGRPEPLILLAIMDTTMRKRAERQSLETEERLRTIVDTAADAIVTIDELGIIDSINASAARMFGYTAHELIGKNVKVLMPAPPRDHHDGYLADYRHTGEKHIIGIGREVEGRRSDGTSLPIDLAVSEYEDRGRRMFTGVLRDLSARKTLEREVIQVATMEQQRIGQELHDTSAQELTALGLLADILISTLKEKAPVEAGIAAKMAEALRRVIGQLRAFARGLIGVEVDSEGLMEALAELASRTTQLHDVPCAFHCREPVHLANNQAATQLYSIARESITNALKHANPKSLKIGLETVGRSAVLSVENDGDGFREPMSNADGLGLKIMRYRAGLIDAQLSVGPRESGGTIVTCTCDKDPKHAHDQEPVR